MNNNKTSFLTTKKERAAYYLYGTGGGLFFNLTSTLLPTFLLLQGINLEALAFAMLIVKIWDSINDLFFGGIVDKIKMKKGKFLPWLRAAFVFGPLAIFFMYSMPIDLDTNIKLVWYVAAYVCIDLATTIGEVPGQGILTTMTNNPDERTYILSKNRFITVIASFPYTLFAPVLLGASVGMSAQTLGFIVLFVVVLFQLPYIICCKERVNIQFETVEDKKIGFKEMFSYQKNNKDFWVLQFSNFVLVATYFMNGIGLLVGFYLFGTTLIAVPIAIAGLVATVIVYFLLPMLLRKWSKMQVSRASTYLAGIIAIIIYFVGYGDVTLYMILMSLMVLAVAPRNYLMFMFLPDCIEHTTYKTGVDSRGITYALSSFMGKLSASISGSLGFFLLGLFGWQEVVAGSFAELEALNIQQTPEALHGLWMLATLFLGIGTIVSAMISHFYKIDEEEVKIMAQCNSGNISREEAEELMKH